MQTVERRKKKEIKLFRKMVRKKNESDAMPRGNRSSLNSKLGWLCDVEEITEKEGGNENEGWHANDAAAAAANDDNDDDVDRQVSMPKRVK